MILGNDREKVIENIRTAAKTQDFYAKVELADPVLSAEEKKEITDRYLASQGHPAFRLKTLVAEGLANFLTTCINRNTDVVNEKGIVLPSCGVIITSNHFSPFENTVIRHYVRSYSRKLSIVSQVTNFAMSGGLGFLMNYADTIPLSDNFHYICRDLLPILSDRLNKGETVLIYPEQEMWFNYRKPRPPKEGAYYFASRLNTPILSCFVEIVDREEDDNEQFKKVRYVLHILDLLTPDPKKSIRENCVALGEQDYELKKKAYERIYGKPLSYEFDKSDIAGWTGAADNG